MDVSPVLENKTNLQNVLINYPVDVYPAKEMFIAWLLEKGGPEAVALFEVLTTCEHLSTWRYDVLERKHRLSEFGYKLLDSKKRELAWAVKQFKVKYPQNG